MGPRFENKVALITGAASGIGRSVMERLESEGAAVLAVDNDADRLASTIGSMDSNKAIAMPCDVSDSIQVERMVAQAIERFGLIDILVNNAGIGNPRQGRLHEISLEDWDLVQATNVRGIFLMLRAVIPHMLQNGGGSIINMASVASFRATAKASSYVTSKGAVLMMTRAAAIDYAKDNIRINAVCPGTTNTDILSGLTPEMSAMLLSRAPQGRLGEPDEVAALVAFLLSDDALHITGGSYIIDGGRCAA